MRFLFATLFLVALLVCELAYAKVYKWVDENGKIHYSDKPIDDKSKEIKVNKEPSEKQIRDAKQRTNKRLNAYKRLSESTEKERADKEKVAEQEAIEAKEVKAACKEARRLINVYNRGRPVYQEDENGKRVYLRLSDDEKNKKIAVLQDMIKQRCH